ncbi:MAG TPA: hypothetical protein VFC02_15555 [Anaerolineales bacterium]|jgi:hypothetical protein|nr:hypothetical protein [Anaerolineales bacterium]
MKMSLGAKSLALFVLSLLFLVLLTLFESLLSGLSLTAERVISALLLVLPGLIGIVLGVLSMLRKEPRVWVAILGVILNALFVLFQTAVLFFAG